MGMLADIVIPAVLGAVLIVVLYLLKGFLSFVLGIPLWLILSFVVAALTLIFIPTNVCIGFWRFGKEGFVFMQARKDGVPVICDVEIGTNNAEFVIGTKKDPKDPLFEDERSGVKADPSLVSAYAEPMRFAGGLDIVGYGYHNWLPQTVRNHLAFKAIAEYFNSNEMRDLMFLTINEKIELISKPEHFLAADIQTKVSKYFKTQRTDEKGKIVHYRQFQGSDGKWYEQEIRIEDIVQLIQKAKADITKLPIATGYFCMNEAFRYNNVPYSAQHLASLKNMLQKLNDEKWMKMLNWMQWGTIGIGLIAAMVVGSVIILQVIK